MQKSSFILGRSPFPDFLGGALDFPQMASSRILNRKCLALSHGEYAKDYGCRPLPEGTHLLRGAPPQVRRVLWTDLCHLQIPRLKPYPPV